MAGLIVQGAKSRLVVRTRSEGMLSPLAHDLEIACERFEATADPSPLKGTLQVAPRSMRVVAASRSGKPSSLSDSDRREIEERIARDVLPGEVVVTGELPDGAARARCRIEVRGLKGTTSVDVPVRHRVEGAAHVLEGRCMLSLKAMGVSAPKGPMGMFRLSDGVEIEFSITLAPS